MFIFLLFLISFCVTDFQNKQTITTTTTTTTTTTKITEKWFDNKQPTGENIRLGVLRKLKQREKRAGVVSSRHRVRNRHVQPASGRSEPCADARQIAMLVQASTTLAVLFNYRVARD